MKKLTRISPKQATADTTTSNETPNSPGGGGMINKSRFKVIFLLAAMAAMALYQSRGMVPRLLPSSPPPPPPPPPKDLVPKTPDVDNTSTATTTSKTTGGIFFCGYENFKLGTEIFPDYMNRWWGGLDNQMHNLLQSHHSKRLPNSDDILIMGMHGPCQNAPRNFPGKVLFVNGEPNGDNMPKTITLAGRQGIGQDVYQIGLLPDTPNSVMMYHGSWNLMRMDEALWSTLWDPSRKPRNSGKYKGLMYLNGKCHPHREAAVNLISNIMTVYYGRCKGNADFLPDKFKRMPSLPSQNHWKYNRDTYSEYTFCLAMENTDREHYLSEKIIIAFLSGCVPIYYGSHEVFDVFNRDAFVFYDVQNPQPALNQLRLLTQNETSYQEMLNQPIMADGEETVRKYFSVSDRIGGGFLKNKLRKTMGLGA